ncbi:MAG TPA: DUF1993 domain-containing protein [Burkholderiaceae bacterium]|jgi:hypothetical protein|nr:DUF1993 domain-containing protein [Burkholderiaceae bacterium]
MPFSIHTVAIMSSRHMLGSLSHVLKKAEAHCEARKIDPSVLLAARLYPDMLPLTAQVQIATDQAKGAAARLAGVDIPKFEDDEKTFPECQERIQKTLAFLETLKPAQFEGAESKEITIPARDQTLKFSGQDYLLTRALPNIYFHVTTAYDILRHNGVEIGKSDYLGGGR